MSINTIFAESYLDSEIKKIGRVGAQFFCNFKFMFYNLKINGRCGCIRVMEFDK